MLRSRRGWRGSVIEPGVRCGAAACLGRVLSEAACRAHRRPSRLDSAGQIGNALHTRKIEPAPYGDDQGWRMEGMPERARSTRTFD
jgi:hypothetical protein